MEKGGENPQFNLRGHLQTRERGINEGRKSISFNMKKDWV